MTDLENRLRKALVGLIGEDDPLVLIGMLEHFEENKGKINPYDYQVSTNAIKLLIETKPLFTEFTD